VKRARAVARWGALGGAVLVAAAAPRPAAAGDPPCAATAGFDRSRVSVGQQLIYRVRIAHSDAVAAVEWSEAPSFPGFRAEWLPGAVDPETAAAAPRRWRRREERRALFPERSGRLQVKPPDLVCRLAGGETFAVSLPVAAVEAAAPPAAEGGRPEVDLVGPLSLQTLVTPRAVELGGSVRVAIMLRGEGNLWIAEDPLAPVANADVFRRRPELTRETGERLVFKRHFAYDIVPLESGTLLVPGVRLVYFDPTTGRYDSAVSDPVRVAVRPRTAGRDAAATGGPPRARAAEGSAAAEAAPSAAPGPGRPTRGAAALAATVLAVALLAAFAMWRARRRRALKAFDAALRDRPDGSDEAAALAHALRRALTRHVPDARARSAEEIASLPALPGAVADAARLLEAIDRSRFDPKATRPEAERVRAAVARL